MAVNQGAFFNPSHRRVHSILELSVAIWYYFPMNFFSFFIMMAYLIWTVHLTVAYLDIRLVSSLEALPPHHFYSLWWSHFVICSKVSSFVAWKAKMSACPLQISKAAPYPHVPIQYCVCPRRNLILPGSFASESKAVKLSCSYILLGKFCRQ